MPAGDKRLSNFTAITTFASGDSFGAYDTSAGIEGKVTGTVILTWLGASLDMSTIASGGALPVAYGGTGRATGTTAYALVAAGTTATGAQQTLAAGATTEILVGGGGAALPVWTTATGTGAPVRAGSPTFTTKLTTPEIQSAGTLTLTPASASNVLIQTGSTGKFQVDGSAGNSGKILISTSETTVVDGDVVGRVDFQAPDEASGGDSVSVCASIWAEADATFTSGDNSCELVFATAASEVATEKMRLTSDGKLGVNTATPGRDLTVGDGTGTRYIEVDAAAASQAAVEFSKAGATKWIIYVNTSEDDLTFYDGTSTRLMLEKGGNLGVNTTSFPSGGGDGAIILANTTDPTGLGAGTAGIFAKDISTVSSIHHVDEAGTVTGYGPHDPESGEWVHKDENHFSGQRRLFRMEKILRFLATKYPEIAELIEDTVLPSDELISWEANQSHHEAVRAASIEKALANKTVPPDPYVRKGEPAFLGKFRDTQRAG